MTDKRRIPTIIDVAREAGVSKSAASRALLGQSEVSPATIERVQAAAQALGYVPNAMARGLVEQRTNIIGVHVRDASNVFYAAMLGAMHARAVTHGYRLISTSGTWKLLVDEEVEALSTLVSLRVDGIIVCSSALPAEHIVPFAGRIPTVVTGRPEVDPRLSAIYVDEVQGGRSMARHIVSLGHHRIGVVMEAAAQSISQHARSEAMVAELRQLGAEAVAIDGSGDAEAATAAAHEVLAHDLTAVLCPTNPVAVTVIEALRQLGLTVPDDVSVAGYDTTGPLGAPELGITSFRTPVQRVAAEAVDLVLAMVGGQPDTGAHLRRRGRVEVGRTAGPPPPGGSRRLVSRAGGAPAGSSPDGR